MGAVVSVMTDAGSACARTYRTVPRIGVRGRRHDASGMGAVVCGFLTCYVAFIPGGLMLRSSPWPTAFPLRERDIT